MYAQLKQCCSRRAVVHLFLFPMQLSEVSWLALLVQVQQTCSPRLRRALKLAVDTTCTLRSLTICKSVFMLLRLIFNLCFSLDNLGISAAECSDFATNWVSLSCVQSVSQIFSILTFKETLCSVTFDLCLANANKPHQ